MKMEEKEQTLGIWQYFMLVLSVVSLVLLAVQSFVTLEDNAANILWRVDYLICAVFFAEFLWRLVQTRPRSAYLKWGWLDLISSIPMIPEFRIARLARIARIVRVLRGARASRNLLRIFLVHRARSTFAAVVFGSFVLLLFSAIAIVSVEPSLSPRDAVWWCLFALITAEYGEFYPASTEGRIIAGLLMTAGVAIFGTFTASVASFFLEEEQQEDEERDSVILAEISGLKQEVSELRKELKGNPPNGRHS